MKRSSKTHCTLDKFCLEHPRVALAFSGGCDSSYLLAALVDRGVDVRPYYVNTAFQASFELDDARRVAREVGVDVHVIELDILSNNTICSNSVDRCYWCKRFIFSNILDKAKPAGFEILVDGTNASDDPARRPGFRALEELAVLSPLRLANMTKDDIRAASHALGLSTADKPNFSCYATKIETGQKITQERLNEVAHKLQFNPR